MHRTTSNCKSEEVLREIDRALEACLNSQIPVTITASGDGCGAKLYQGGDIQNLALVVERSNIGPALSLAESFLATQVPPQGPRTD